jgi:predicted nucleic acid-binding protein
MQPAKAQSAKTRYLDASALVKLVVDEGDHQRLRDFFNANINFAATPLCLAEALGVVKGKWSKKQLSAEQYFAATRRLIIETWGERIEVDSVDLFTPDNQEAVEALAKRHELDLSDALQIETILHGRYRNLVGDSAAVLITADSGLARAAREEGIRVWNCGDSAPPEWV